jgi:hypothetical protein
MKLQFFRFLSEWVDRIEKLQQKVQYLSDTEINEALK